MKKESNPKCLIIGIGNCGRQDDGLGWEFLDLLQKTPQPEINLKLEYRYQLQIEDAELLNGYDCVFFVDASKHILEEGFYIRKVIGNNQYGFTSHSLTPETIVYLANQLYKHHPNAYLIEIEGFKFNLMQGLTFNARRNLHNSFVSFLKILNTSIVKNRKMEKI